MSTRSQLRVDTLIDLSVLHAGGVPSPLDLPLPPAADDDPALPPFRYAEVVAEMGFDPLRFKDFVARWSA